LQCGEPDLAGDFLGPDRQSRAESYKQGKDYARHHFATEAVVISALIESELVDLRENEAMEYLRGLGVENSGVHALHSRRLSFTRLRTFLTTGEKKRVPGQFTGVRKRRPPRE